jgi:hypothetical protein
MWSRRQKKGFKKIKVFLHLKNHPVLDEILKEKYILLYRTKKLKLTLWISHPRLHIHFYLGGGGGNLPGEKGRGWGNTGAQAIFSNMIRVEYDR